MAHMQVRQSLAGFARPDCKILTQCTKACLERAPRRRSRLYVPVQAAAATTFPSFMPPAILEVTEPAAVSMASSMRRVPITFEFYTDTVMRTTVTTSVAPVPIPDGSVATVSTTSSRTTTTTITTSGKTSDVTIDVNSNTTSKPEGRAGSTLPTDEITASSTANISSVPASTVSGTSSAPANGSNSGSETNSNSAVGRVSGDSTTTIGSSGDALRRATVDTAFLGPSSEQLASYPANAPAVVLLHSFDSSCLEFRRLIPLLSQHLPTYSVDLVGWGFTDNSMFAKDTALKVLPAHKRAHLRAFIDTQLGGRPVLLVGASVGGAVALDFTLAHNEVVQKLVLIDAQGFIDGLGPMGSLPRQFAVWGVQLLRSVGLRQQANQLAYYNKARWATDDAMRVGRLHTFMPGWLEANVGFIRGGGYSLSKYISKVQKETLVLWGRQDKILDPGTAQRFEETLPNSRLLWIEECGHSPHLEQPEVTAKHILEFAGVQPGAAAAAGPQAKSAVAA